MGELPRSLAFYASIVYLLAWENVTHFPIFIFLLTRCLKGMQATLRLPSKLINCSEIMLPMCMSNFITSSNEMVATAGKYTGFQLLTINCSSFLPRLSKSAPLNPHSKAPWPRIVHMQICHVLIPKHDARLLLQAISRQHCRVHHEMFFVVRSQRKKPLPLLFGHLGTFVRGAFLTVNKNGSWPLVGTVLSVDRKWVVRYEVHFLAQQAVCQATATWEALEFIDGAGDE